MTPDQHVNNTREKMQKALEHLQSELVGIRGSRAHPGLVENVKVEAYGTKMVLKELASISVLDPRLLQVQVWDQANTSVVDRAIREANLGLNPVTDNNLIKIPIPPLSEERRNQMKKLVREKSEEAHVAVRNIRREAVEFIGKSEKAGGITEDEKFRLIDQVQKVTDEFTKNIDTISDQKSEEVMKF